MPKYMYFLFMSNFGIHNQVKITLNIWNGLNIKVKMVDLIILSHKSCWNVEGSIEPRVGAAYFLTRLPHSHASLLSKLDSAMANAWSAHIGYLKSIVKTSSATRPNCITMYSTKRRKKKCHGQSICTYTYKTNTY